MSLERFYAELGPWLFGEAEVAHVEQRLGPSSSGTEHLDFYRVLVGRNLDKILREVFVSVHALVTRDHPGLWPELVRGYAAAETAGPHDPNRYGLGFSDYLARRRGERGEYSALLEELADYHMCRYLAAAAPDPDDGDDGFEQRVFVRGYTHPVPKIVSALARDPEAEVAPPQPTMIIVYRSLLPPEPLRTHWPSAAQVAALARRQGLAVPPALAGLDPATLDEGLAQLIAAGILRE